MMWPFKRRNRQPCDEALAAKAAKIEAEIELDTARKKYREVTNQTAELKAINHRNHFSESLTRAFREGAV